MYITISNWSIAHIIYHVSYQVGYIFHKQKPTTTPHYWWFHKQSNMASCEILEIIHECNICHCHVWLLEDILECSSPRIGLRENYRKPLDFIGKTWGETCENMGNHDEVEIDFDWLWWFESEFGVERYFKKHQTKWVIGDMLDECRWYFCGYDMIQLILSVITNYYLSLLPAQWHLKNGLLHFHNPNHKMICISHQF